MFIYPRDLTEEIRKRWKVVSEEYDDQPPQLPPDKVLSPLLDVCFHASMLTEEDRRIEFRVVYCSRAEAKREARKGINAFGGFSPMEFSRPREFSVGELLRLAPATDMNSVLIAVERFDKRKKEPDLRIWGVIDTGSSFWTSLAADTDQMSLPPNYLTISSEDPGNLTISRRGMILFSLRNGEVNAPSVTALSSGPVSEFFEPAREVMCQQVAKLRGLQGKQNQSGGEDPDRDICRRRYNGILQRLLYHIRDKHHGGILLVVPDSVNSGSRELKERIVFKYPSSHDQAWQMLIESTALNQSFFDLLSPMLQGGSAFTPSNFKELLALQRGRGFANRALADAIRFMATLSSVDGAVVMTDRFRLLGFGGEIVVSAPNLTEIAVCSPRSDKVEKKISIESFGTRHRSTFRFCHSLPESTGFVISQDGGVKAVRRIGRQLILWPDVNYGVFGY